MCLSATHAASRWCPARDRYHDRQPSHPVRVRTARLGHPPRMHEVLSVASCGQSARPVAALGDLQVAWLLMLLPLFLRGNTRQLGPTSSPKRQSLSASDGFCMATRVRPSRPQHGAGALVALARAPLFDAQPAIRARAPAHGVGEPLSCADAASKCRRVGFIGNAFKRVKLTFFKEFIMCIRFVCSFTVFIPFIHAVYRANNMI